MNNKRIVAKWLNTTIWDRGGFYRHIFMTEDFQWLAVDSDVYNFILTTYSFTKEYLLSTGDTKNWEKIFDKIEAGAPPDWVADDFKCSCGVWATMGKSWILHSSTCNFKVGPPAAVKNNDGRGDCFKCGQLTKQMGGGAYDVCENKECSWYNN